MSKSKSDSILPNLKKQLQQTFSTSPFLIIGVSGGADSMALLYALHKLNIDGFVVHVNYGLRVEESNGDQELVEQVSAMWGFECCSIRPGKAPEGKNFQQWARDTRYEFFEDLKKEYNADGIAVAHHQDDQLETILFRILRGSGLDKLSAMNEWDDSRSIWRPFLNITKQNLVDFCEKEHIPYRTDASNETSNYARNAIRNDVFPIFERFVEGWKGSLSTISEMALVYGESLDALLPADKEIHSLQVRDISAHSERLQGALLKRFIEERSEVKLSKGQTLQLIELLSAPTGKKVAVDNQVTVFKDRESIILKKHDLDEAEPFTEIIIEKSEAEKGTIVEQWKIQISDEPHTTLFVDEASTKWPLRFRKWENGDVFNPLGMSGSQKVSDHLTNRKINSAKREETLILSDSDGTICAILYPEPTKNGQIGNIAESCKVTESTKRYLCIEKI
jgi:tRNA(Ile)-lysidine synthase